MSSFNKIACLGNCIRQKKNSRNVFIYQQKLIVFYVVLNPKQNFNFAN